MSITLNTPGSLRIAIATGTILATIPLALNSLLTDAPTATQLQRASMLAVVAVAYTVVVRSTELIRRAIRRNYQPHLQGAWMLAAAVALPPALIPLVGLVSFAAEWAYQRHSANMARKITTFCAVTVAAEIGSLAVGSGDRAATWTWAGAPIAEVVDFVLILTIALALDGRVKLMTRLETMGELPSYAGVLAQVVIGVAAGLAVTVSGWGTVLVWAALPALVEVQRRSMAAALRHDHSFDAETGAYQLQAFYSAISPVLQYPASMFLVVMASADRDAMKTVHRTVKQQMHQSNDALVCRYAPDALCVTYLKIKGDSAEVVQEILRRDLAKTGVSVDVAVAVVNGPDEVFTAVADAYLQAKRRLRAA